MLYLVINNGVIYNTQSDGDVRDALDSVSRLYLGKQYDIRDVYPLARVFAEMTDTEMVYLGTVEDLG